MKKIPYPLIYCTKEQLRKLWIYHHMSIENCPNAGLDPSVTGMRRKFWGWDAPLVKHGRYVYKVPLDVYKALGG